MDNPEQYRKLVASVESVEVYLLNSIARRAPKIAWPLEVETSTKLEEQVEREGRQVVASIVAQVVGRPSRKKAIANGEVQAEPQFYVEMTWQVVYTLSTAEPFPEDVIKDFLHRNGVLNVWPYVREYVSSVTARMNLPALYLPVVKFLR